MPLQLPDIFREGDTGNNLAILICLYYTIKTGLEIDVSEKGEKGKTVDPPAKISTV